VAQVVYAAASSDPSDPGKTYQNFAPAILTQLRKRSGIALPGVRTRSAGVTRTRVAVLTSGATRKLLVSCRDLPID